MSRATRGFTLIEMLVVIAVIGVLASVVGPMVFRNVGDARVAAARAQMETFILALETYRLDNDRYPTTSQGLQALRARPAADPRPRGWRGPYLRRDVPADPWGNPYRYESPGRANPESFDLESLGRDGRPGGAGEDADVKSWDSGRP